MRPDDLSVVGFGGGCHWCTEAVFQSLKGVHKVEQGWIRSSAPHDAWSEAVLVHFQPDVIGLNTLIDIHLLTHSSTSDHRMRGTYRSAIYTLDREQQKACERTLEALREENAADYVTKVLPFEGFKLNRSDLLNYYRTRKETPFCKRYIHPKLQELRQRYATLLKPEFAGNGS